MMVGAQQTGIGHDRGPAGGSPALRGDPHWWMGLLQRGNGHPGIVHLPMLAFKIHFLAGPQEFHQRKTFLKPAGPVSAGGAGGLQLSLPVSDPSAQNELSVAYVVQRYDLLSKVHRVLHGQQHHARNKFQSCRFRRQPGQQGDGLHPNRGMAHPVLGGVNPHEAPGPSSSHHLGGILDLLVHRLHRVIHEISYVKCDVQFSPPLV